MSEKEVIEALRNEVKLSPIANAVFHLFALRARARQTVTVSSLYQRMLKEGFSYRKSDYIPIIKMLAKAGFGIIDTDQKGRIKGLKDVKVTLQSIGAAAVGHDIQFKRMKKRTKFSNLVNKPDIIKDSEILETTLSEAMTKKEDIKPLDIRLTILVNGKPVEIKVSDNLTAGELAMLITSITH